ncbi:hypothetical protein A2999_02900 [Candidatus Wolfebacteria bacterium RIFCSPLOWO2_01_FULL_38_11]|uniref:Uncharacterized protein n=2 Tax=Candidatus Wolfeibacteriota TaxID=1752735 RepID=A0A0G0FZP8_9BACT|nr:MAG: hypothetical protein US36_C0002G0002 [Candidatus Wolfebacteria bacterium GW2011_GWC1_37_10]OGM91405.1 MAG: hypothetical protein A2999_02900 [Candidatus Wolfebacteria bacterium RIFCSPLOWO2_01_FULL_38_11]
MVAFTDWIKNVLKIRKKEKQQKPKTLIEDICSHIFNQISSGKCPNCGYDHKEGFTVVARGGIALNVECNSCKAKYWVAPLPIRLAARLE